MLFLKKKNVPSLRSRNKYPTFFPFFENAVKESKSESFSVVSDSLQPHVGVGSLSLLQGIFQI